MITQARRITQKPKGKKLGKLGYFYKNFCLGKSKVKRQTANWESLFKKKSFIFKSFQIYRKVARVVQRTVCFHSDSPVNSLTHLFYHSLSP